MAAAAAPTKLGLIGLGRLGLAAALCFEEAGFEVLGCDVVPAVVDAVNARKFESNEPSVTTMLAASTKLKATLSLREVCDFADVLMIFVDTPTGVGESRSYDHSKLGKVLSAINALKVSGKHVTVGCTVQPGYLRDVGSLLVADCPGTTLSYNPEFIAQGSIVADFVRPDMVLIGEGSPAAGDALEAVYKRMVKNEPRICRMSAASAEVTKLALNCFCTMKVTFANMVGDVADRTEGADAHDILQAVGADSRVGGKYLRPGYGFGGPCFPRDNRAFAYHARSVGVDALLSKSTDQYNDMHARYQVDALLDQDLPLYTFQDVVYKDGCKVPIIEESQKLKVARLLAQKGRKVLIRDREEIVMLVKQESGSLFTYEVIPEEDA